MKIRIIILLVTALTLNKVYAQTTYISNPDGSTSEQKVIDANEILTEKSGRMVQIDAILAKDQKEISALQDEKASLQEEITALEVVIQKSQDAIPVNP